MRTIVLIASLTLAGCATTYVPNASMEYRQNFDVAKYQCMQETQPQGSIGVQGSQNFVAAAIATFALVEGAAAASRFQACMAARGWVPKP